MHKQWNDHALLAQFHNGLKEEVKDDVSKAEKPHERSELIELAIRIDNRQYERRLEKRKEQLLRPSRRTSSRGTIPIDPSLWSWTLLSDTRVVGVTTID